MHVPAINRRADDGTRYRSVAVVPIRVAGNAKPWGVVISTSDRRDRFDNDPHSLGAISAQAIRLFAGMIALVAAAQISSARPVAGTSKKP
jgi:GAF domain-containing protein